MKKTFFWGLSFLITALFAVFQRVTGPTYPLKDAVFLDGGSSAGFLLPRSCAVGGGGCLIEINSPEKVKGYVSWRRYRTEDPWAEIIMPYRNGVLSARLPGQPPAGKLEYRVFIKQKKGDLELYGKPVVVRFKGVVPKAILAPHILFMFLFMLFSVRIFITVFTADTVVRHAVILNIIFLMLGGFIFGPLTQYHAFGAYWTGWPFGHDLTDNKTLVMLTCWLAALYAVFRAREPRPWLLAAFAVTAAVYLVPHSLLGSELDYSKADTATKTAIGHKL
ncbi:MAG: hypothetical protein A2X28_05575 [Elusimicrobia bacterium GWA2_56_46]|nr:MAG: hypothetical protein A2X28_05575 [Elusimicrobia bacterium GWA2_56_46]OGR53924.1 MAG: hypothetical protein A2X39_07270 [Elusimicrobia bacterium GWC2_56_31]HBB68289.1 hypothetical protein [Elusimicrobiota bacterium]HBW23210.1 hypothetical protein [Elusimicrobiota bacterium]